MLGVGKSFDVICRELTYGGKDFALYFVDGFAKDDILNRVMDHLSKLERKDLVPGTINRLIRTHLPYLEVESTKKIDEVVTAVLSGPLALLVDGEEEAILIDARTYPARNPEEPDVERVVRGSRDGFVETLTFNTALTRRGSGILPFAWSTCRWAPAQKPTSASLTWRMWRIPSWWRRSGAP